MSNQNQDPSKSNSFHKGAGKSSRTTGSGYDRTYPTTTARQIDTEKPLKEDITTDPYKSPVSANGNQSRLGSVPKLKPQDELCMKDILTPIVGDKSYANLGDYINMVQRKNLKPFDSIDERSGENNGQNEESVSSDELIIEALKFAEQCSPLLTGSESEVGSIKLPEAEEEFSQWYYDKLGDYEQCYVQTAAVLHGTPAHEISMQADILYRSIHDGAEKRESSIRLVSNHGDRQKTQYTETFSFSDLLIQRIPSRKLHLRTHAITRQEMGVEHLYWQDVDQYGLSTFGLNLLAFLTTELINRGEQGQKFLNVIYSWSQDNEKSELSLKAAHAYGVVLWCYDENLLCTRANEWAQVKSHLSWRRSAELLNGAYEIERIRSDEKANEIKPSSIVLRLLDSWVAQVHQYFNEHEQFSMQENKTLSAEAQAQKDKANLTLATNLAWTVANTYELIGKRWPEIALPGLQRLLQLPLLESTYYTRSIYAAVVSTYVNLARSRRVYDVLRHLADHAEDLSNRRQMPLKTVERLKYRLYRQISLNVILEAFFLIAIESYLGRQKEPPTSYSLTRSLSPQPAIPDPDGKDVLLTGLLSQMGVESREHITVLLCTAIMEKKSRLAFSLLRKWADNVSEMSEKQEINRIVVNLGKTVETWCRNLEEQGFRAPPAIDAYKSRLDQWDE